MSGSGNLSYLFTWVLCTCCISIILIYSYVCVRHRLGTFDAYICCSIDIRNIWFKFTTPYNQTRKDNSKACIWYISSAPHDNAVSFICIRILTLPRLMYAITFALKFKTPSPLILLRLSCSWINSDFRSPSLCIVWLFMLRVHNIIPICDAGYRWSCIYMMTNIDWSLNIDGLIPSIKLVYKYYGSGPPSNYTTPTKSHTGPSWSMVVVRTVPVATQVVNSNPVHGDTTICDKVWQCKTSLDTEWPVFATAQKWRQTTPCIGFRAPAAENTPNSISVPRDCSNWSTRETKWSGYAPKVTSLPTRFIVFHILS